MTVAHTSGFSAEVRIRLHINGDILNVAQIDPYTLTLRGDYASHQPCDGQLLISIDDFTERQNVLLPEGIAAESRQVKYSRISA